MLLLAVFGGFVMAFAGEFLIAVKGCWPLYAFMAWWWSTPWRRSWFPRGVGVTAPARALAVIALPFVLLFAGLAITAATWALSGPPEPRRFPCSPPATSRARRIGSPR